MAVALKEACAKCGKAMTDAEIGDTWWTSGQKLHWKYLCQVCALSHRLYEPDGSVRGKQWIDGTEQLPLL